MFPRCYPLQEILYHFLIENQSSISHHAVSQFPLFKSSAFSGFEGFGNLSMTRVVFSPPKTENMRQFAFAVYQFTPLSQLQERIFAPAGFWPRGQNPRRHPRVPRVYVYTYKRNIKKVLKKCVGSMEIFSI